MFEKLQAKLTGHHASHPLAKQRDEFLGVSATTPIERKAHFTPEIVGAAAAYQAWQYYQIHDAHTGGGKVSHLRGKQIMSELAMNQVPKLIEERGLPFNETWLCLAADKDRKTFIKLAQAWAVRDAKRALRESGFYTTTELEAAEQDEMDGHKIL